MNVEIMKGEKAKSYKIKENITREDLLDAGFKDGHWRCKEECVSKYIRLINDIELDIAIKTDPIGFDDFENIEVMDSSFGQTYTPFYGDNYKRYIDNFPYLQEVITRYNETMDSLGIFEELVLYEKER